MRACLLMALAWGLAAATTYAETAAQTRFIASFNASVGRTPTEEEQALWQKVAGPNAAFPGDNASLVKFVVRDVLQREATSEEVSKYSAKLESGTTLGRFWADLATSGEAMFVIQFAAVARYVPSPEVREYWLTRAGKGARDKAFGRFPDDKDFGKFVDFTYHYLLGRAPSSEETKRDATRLIRTQDLRAYWFEVFSGAERQTFVQSHRECIDLTIVCAK